MNNLYQNKGKFLLFILFLISPFYSYSTHIVGGTLTYTHLGGSSYRITLKLYRDCSGIALPTDVDITVLQPDGSQFVPSRDINIPLTSKSFVPAFVDTCVIQPNVCVQEGIYTKVVNNLPGGGYHLYYNLCCRNGSLANINNPLSTGASFYTYIPPLSNIWLEDFNLPNNTSVDAGTTGWTRTLPVPGPTTYAVVKNKLFEANETNGEVVWNSDIINIAGRPGGVNLSVDLSENGSMEASDYIKVFYKLNGGAETPFPTNGSFFDDFGSAMATATGIVGNTVQIVVRLKNDDSNEFHRFDDVLVADNVITNSSPSFTSFPPIFVCQGNPLVFDHSASEANGDSLVYSLYQPYTDDLPTFPGNVATFTGVSYKAGYGPTNPLGGAVGSVVINPSTGILTTTPATAGQFVVGVKVKEYRNGVFLSEVTRDFQFNVLNCPPPGHASFAAAKVCSGKSLTFNNTSPASMTLFSWNFGDAASGASNTSTLRNPSHTFTAVGSYNVRLISNPGSACADTAFNTVTVSSVTAAYTAPGPSCVGKVVSFTDASTATGTTVTGWLWNFGDGQTSTTKNPTHTYATSGTMSIKLVATNAFGCKDSVTHTVAIQALPVVSAGPNQTVCANNSVVTLAGTVTGATGGTWTTGGTGTFGSATVLNTTYTPSAADKTAGTVTLTLTSTGNGNCNAVTSTMTITITPVPTVNAGVDKTVCANNPAAAITGTVTVATGGTWSGGGGTFFPNANTLVMTYTPSAAERTALTPVTLTLTSTGNGSCAAVTDQMIVNITAAPTINPGANQSVCSNNAVVTLAATETVATGVQWTTAGSGTFANSTALNTTYTPSAADKTAGTVTLTAATTGNGTCNAVSAPMTVTITVAPTSTPGANQTVCANNATVTLNGSVTVATGGTWTTAGSGSFANANALSTTYTPSAADKTAGSVVLTLTTTGNGTCNPVANSLTVTITAAPTSNAGLPATVCANNPAIALSGSVTVATGGTWSSGAGAYSPNNNTLVTTYTPTAAEITAGTVTLTLTTTGNGTCNPVSSTKTITITAAPVVNAGSDQTVCANNALVTLSGTSVSAPATGGTWTTNGSGTFANANAVSTTYTPSAADKTAGTVTLTLTSTPANAGGCIAVSDPMIVTITPAPTINAGVDQTVCANNSVTTITATKTVATGVQWTTGGSGTFANSTALSTTYTPSAADVTAGTVTLTATTTGIGTCIAVNDAMIITITPAPTANAGAATTVCANNAAVTLNGSVTVATGGTWSGGAGTFAPNANTLNATYTPSAAEKTAGTVTLTLTTTGNGTCIAATSTKTITITPAPTVNAGVDQTVCSNNAVTTIAATETVATGIQWTTAGTGTFGNSALANTTYTPSAADKTAGTVTLTATTTGNGTCIAVADQMIITITAPPVPNAGVDQTVCANNTLVTLTGTVTAPATGGAWTSGGTGIFANASALSTTYTPSAADITAGTVTLTLTTTPANAGNCIPVTDQMVITITPKPTISAGPDKTVCANNANVQLVGTFTVATGATWIPISGTGSFSPSATVTTTTYIPSAADIAGGFISIKYRTSGNGNCVAEEDTMSIVFFPAPTVNAGPNQNICKNNNVATLAGTVGLAPSTRTWSTAGTGTFGNINTLNTNYTPSAADIAAGAVTLTLTVTKTQAGASCNAVSSTMTITYTNPPTVNAGGDQTVCANNAVVTLAGSVTAPATGGAWTSNGTGTFANANALSTTYTPSAADKTAGTVTVTLTTTPANAGGCIAVSDAMVITITPAPTANANADQSVCANNATTTLNGSVTVATGGTWTSNGTGSFAPNANTLNASYIPSAADKTAGSVTLTLTTTGNGNCVAVTDQMIITITPAPTANAGTDITICADNPKANLSGSITVATGAQWVGGAGTFTPNNTTLATQYSATAAEVAAGSVTLTLITTINGNCNSVSDQVLITIGPAPTVNAGSDQTICSTSPNAPLNGTVTVATGGTWTSNGTGSFSPSATTLNASYVPSAADKTAGNITLTLTTTGNGTCIAVQDQMVINITSNPTSSAGPAQTVCTNSLPVQLAGTGSPSQWIGGTGTFNPNRNTLNALYTPSAAEITAGTVTLTLQPNAIGGCATPAATTVTITIPPGPTANAGADKSVCGDITNVNLNGSVGGTATGGTWTTGGTGTFGNPAVLNTTYTPSAADKTAGTVTLTLTTTGVGSCLATTDDIIITITPAPTISAGPDLTRCADVTTVPVSGTVTVATGITWTTAGGGTFSPNNTSLNATYNPTVADKTAGSVTLTITTTTGLGTCNSVSDNMVITFTPAPTVTPGPAQTVCADTAFITLTGSFTAPATGATWSGGAGGTYSPNTVTQPASYTLTAADKAAGTVTFTLTTTGNGTCNAVSGTTVVTITPAPTVNAGTDKTVCGDVASVTISGATVTVAGGQTWTKSGSGTFSPNANALNPTYNLSAADKTGGTVTLTLTSTLNGSCKAVSDQMIITITPAPTVNAGPDKSICADAANVAVTGTVTVATGGTWTSNGTGTFANPALLNTTYTPSAADKAAGTVTLTLTSTGNGTCAAVTDQMILTITPAPTANAGANQTVCADVASVALNGTITVATGSLWSTNGTGAFSPNNINPTSYILSAAEKATVVNLTRTMTLTTTGNGTCNPVTSTMTVTITPAPTVNAGSDQTVCGNNAVVTLAGTVTVATGGKWTTNGTGTFGNANALSTTYTPSAADIAAGSVDLTLTSTGNGTCTQVANTMVVTITPAPVVNAGPDRTVCANNSSVGLIGTVTVATGANWTSGGTGTFSPAANALTTTYLPSAADIAAGTVTLTLSSTGNGTCTAVTDQAIITITPAPTVNPGAAVSVCANNDAVSLSGSVTVATGGQWSGGTGTFAPNATTLITTYTPSAAEVTAGTVTLTLTTTGNGTCNAVSATKVITITPAPVVNAGPDQTICADKASTALAGTVSVATGGAWTTAGTGTFNPNNTTLAASYVPSAVDQTNGTVTLTLTSTGNGTCNAVTDQVILTITPAPTVNAGPDQTMCADQNNITLAGSVTTATGGNWTSTGAGTFSPGSSTLNAFYTPTAAEKTAGTVTLTLTTTGNGTCNAVTDQMVLTITPAPTVNAGVNQTVCADLAGVTLNGTKTVAAGVTWTSAGTGTFAPNNTALNATYTPSAADKTAGSVILTITTTGNGTCTAVTSQMKITITPAPTVDAGPDLNMCADGTGVTITGAVTIATGGTWSTASGTGTFAPDANSLHMTFTPSALQITQGFARITLTTTGNGTCNAVSDQMQVNIAPIPVVNAGPNQTICADAATVNLNGTVTNATGGTWTTNGTGTFANANVLNAVYTPSAADKIAGTLTLTLTSTGNGLCNAYSSTMTLRITPAPTVDAGNATTCSDAGGVQLNGTVTVASGGHWTTTGSGTFTPNANVLNPTYTPSAADIAAGTATITLTTTGNGTCNAVSDIITMGIGPTPTSNAGVDQVVCSSTTGVILNGAITVSTGGIWTSAGSGTFTPDNVTLNATYMPSAADMAAGSVVLTLTTTGNGLCRAVSDQMTISITPGPTVNAGPDQTVCADIANVQLAGVVTISTGGTWTTGGTGTFTPTASTLNAKYVPSAADITAGTVKLTLTTTGNGLCAAIFDTMRITITPAPTIDAGVDQTACSDVPTIALNGSTTVALSGTWTSTGTGTFAPSANNLSVTYTPSAADRSLASLTFTITSTGNGTCNAVSDNMLFTIQPKPVVDAGTAACANNPTFPLNGSVLNATGGLWETTGDGTFAPNTAALNATYTPSANDVANGSVTLLLNSTGNGACHVTTDSVRIDFTAAPIANAGPAVTVCANNGAVTLAGVVTNAGGGAWTSSGTGTFTPNANALNATYNPSNADTTAHSVTLTLTTTGNGTCLPATSTKVITITPAPVVNPGPANICSNNPVVNLNGTVTVAGGGHWTTSGTGTFGNANNLSTTYTFSAADNLSSVIFLTLTSTTNGTCNPVSGVITVNIAPPPTVTAGPDQTICADHANTPLAGAFTVAGGVQWTTSGTGTFSPSSTNPTASYVPSAADKTGGHVQLNIITTGNGACNPVKDSMDITITPAPTLNVGPSTICANNPPVNLSASLTVATTGTWTTTGSGVIAAPNSLNTTYTPSAGDNLAGTLTLKFTTDPTAAPSSCAAISKTITLNITGAPTAGAGADRTICADVASIPLGGTFNNAGGGVWTKISAAAGGTFTPNANAPGASYNPSAADTAAGLVKLLLTTTGNGTCLASTDTLNITITPAPTLNAGPDQVICADKATVNLSALVTVATGVNWTTNNGTGTFTAPGSLATAYNVTSADTTLGFINLIATSKNQGTCNAIKDTVKLTITDAPTVSSGPSVICDDNTGVQLNGKITTATGGLWTSSSASPGVFTPNATTLAPIYVASASERAAGSVTLTLTTTGNGTCNAVSSSTLLKITPPPTATAGADQGICADAGTVTVNGSVTIATGGTWSTLGTGSFAAPNNLGTTYTLTAADTAAHVVKLILTTTGNGGCLPASDTVVVNMTPAPVAIVNAGSNQTVCADAPNATLNGQIQNAAGGVWTTDGNGVFTPNVFTLNATYIPDAVDIADGSIVLVLTSTGSGICNPVTDTMLLTITPKPTVNAGVDKTICADAVNIALNGIVTTATGGAWTTSGTGSFTPSANNPVAVYHPTASDIADSTVVLTLTSTGNGGCSAVSDNMKLFITPAPTVNAGADQIVCSDNKVVNVSGAMTVATAAQWSSTGTGTFLSNTSLATTYTFTSADSTAGSVILSLTTTAQGTCNPVTDALTLTITTGPTISAGPDQTVCADVNGVTLAATKTIAAGVQWSSAGTGAFAPNNSTANAVYSLTAADTTAHSVVLTATTTGNGTCQAVSDQMTVTITPIPVVNAGVDQTACSDVVSMNISGTVKNATGGTWVSSGSGTFGNASNLVTTYAPSAADKAAGIITLTLTSTGMGTCNPVSDQMKINFTPAPTVNAGADQSVCADASSVSLSGAVTVATGGTWSILSGTGSFANANSLSTTYTITTADTTAGSVILLLTTTGNGTCNPVTDQLIVTITHAPTVEAGPAQTICADASGITLAGSITTASGGVWTSTGSGVFAPNTTALAGTYDPSALDRSAGTVTLTLTTTGNGGCNAVSDQMILTITPIPTANAGADQTVCGNNALVTLGGSVTVATGGTWTSAGSGVLTNPTSLNTATYAPSAADIAAGSVAITLTTTGNGTCNPVTDNMVIHITPIPTVNAGPDETVCANNASVPLNATVTVATGGTWTSNGTGSFSPNANTLIATYTPSAADITAGTVTLTLTSTGNGTCLPVTDQMIITVTPSPTSTNSGSTSICADNIIGVPLNGSVTNATGGLWTSSGTGAFSPGASTLNGTYFPSAADKANGSVGLTLTTTGIGNCLAVTSVMTITITKAPTANAGVDKTICADAANVIVTGSVTIATGGTWTSSGSGSFAPSVTALTTSYSPSAADIAAGVVDLTLTTTGNGGCNAVTDQMKLTITPRPVANAGVDKTICADASSVSITGTVTVATGGTWTSTGNGTFTPNANTLAMNYSPSAADKTAGTVTLTLTTTGNGTCNAVSDQMALTITPAPIVTTNAANACAGASGLLIGGTVTNATGGQWTTSGSGVFSPNAFTIAASYTPSAADAASGLVVLTLSSTGNGTCNPVSANMNLTITPLPVSDAGPDVRICRGTPIDLIALHQSAANSYKWFTMTNVQISGNMEVTVAPSTDSSFIVQASDTKGCSTRDTVTIFMVDPPTFGLASHFCLVPPLNVNSNPSSVPATGIFQWFENGNTIVGANTPTLNIGQVGTYIVEFKDGKCLAYDTTIVTLPPQLFSPDTLVCPSMTLDIKTSNIPGATYAWSQYVPNGTAGSINGAANSFQVNVTSTSASNDSTYFVVTVTDNLTCSSNDSIKVVTVPPITLAIPDMSACIGDSLILDGNPGFTNAQSKYNWLFGATPAVVPTAIAVPDTTSQLKVKIAGTYYLNYQLGGCKAKDTTQVTFNQRPVISLADAKNCFEDSPTLTLDAGTGPAADPYTSFLWFTVPDTTVQTKTNQTFMVHSPGKVYVTVTNGLGCPTTDSLNALDVCPPKFDIPQAFFPVADPSGIDPTSDRYKDITFRPFTKYVKNVQFTVFNRWGEIIFYTEDPNVGWDGTYRGELMETGTYPWTLKYDPQESDFGGTVHKKGAVTVLKLAE